MLEAPRRAPRFARAHPRWRSTLASTFTGLGFSRTLIALLSSYLGRKELAGSWTCEDQRCQFGFGGGSRPLVFFRRCPDWMLPIWNNLIWVCKLDLSRPDECQFGCGGGSRPFVFFRRCPDWLLPILNNWIWVCNLDLSRPDGCQFGLAGGSRPLVFFRRCPGWMLPISNNWIWVCKLDLSRPDECQFGCGDGSRPFVSLDGALTGCSQS